MKYVVLLALVLSGCADYKAGRDAYRAKDYTLAKENLEPLAIKYGHTESQVELANLYLQTEDAATHGTIVRDLLNKAAPQEQGKAYYLQGRTYAEGYGVPVDGSRAIELYQKASETGYWKALYSAARLYDRGEIVAKDYNRAEGLYETVINDFGYDRATENLFRLRMNRALENNDVVKAEPYLKQLISNGEERYVKRLADLYRDNITDGSKDREMVALYERVAQKDETGKTWYNLGRMFEKGDLATSAPDGVKAYLYYRKAAEAGHIRAAYYIGRLYDRGSLIEQNQDMAMQYYEYVLSYEEFEPARNALVKLRARIEREKKKNDKSKI